MDLAEMGFSVEETEAPVNHHRDYKGTKAARNGNRRTKVFIAWDGEGYTDESGQHHYALFGSSTGLRVSGEDIAWQDCIPLLFEAPKEAHHVIFAGNYDVTMMFRRMFGTKKLFKGQHIRLTKRYSAMFYKGKFLKITDRERGESRTLYDVFSFFGKSFVKACREYLGDLPVLDDVQRMKEQRNAFTKEDILFGTEVSEYMGQELELLALLCNDLRAKLAAVNIHPQYWHGPGAIASTVLKMKGIKKDKGDYSPVFRKDAEAAYYGGRFEQFHRGAYEGKVYQYDIRSAYPSAMRYLPSLAHAVWHHKMGTPIELDVYGLYHLDYSVKYHPGKIGALPHRTDKRKIIYPAHFAIGWYWGIEIPKELTEYVTEYWVPSWESEPTRPLMFVADMYDQRAELKREGKPEQLALKLAMNSIYGKLAQSKGAKRERDGTVKRPTFHEIVWAGWITAYTRSRIYRAMTSVSGNNIIATETDSVFSLVPLNLPIGEGLGEWECEELEGIKYIANGVSLVKKDDEWKFKTRGFSLAAKGLQDEIEHWDELLSGERDELHIRQTRFGTDTRNKHFSQWYTMDYTLSLSKLNKASKRIHFPMLCYVCHQIKEVNKNMTKAEYDEMRNMQMVGTMAERLHYLIVPPKLKVQESTPYAFGWSKPIDMEGVDFHIDREQDVHMQFFD